MPFRHGNTYRAFGWLVAVCLYFGPALAQQDVEKPSPTVNDGQGVAGEAPTPKSKTDKTPAEDQPAAAEALSPAPPVENKRPAEPPCDARCQAAEQRQKNDLIAQQAMARAAENLIPPAYWQVGLGFLGVILIAVALFYTRRAAISAHDAAVQAARAAKAGIDAVAAMRRSERAYVTMSHTPPGLDLVTRLGRAIFKIEVKNHGRTPATVQRQLRWPVGVN